MASLARFVMATELRVMADRWILPIAQESVDSCSIDFAVTLRFSEEIAVRIEQPDGKPCHQQSPSDL